MPSGVEACKIWIPSLDYYLLPIQLSHCGLSSKKRDAKKKSVRLRMMVRCEEKNNLFLPSDA
jgi:hypothetical protein